MKKIGIFLAALLLGYSGIFVEQIDGTLFLFLIVAIVGFLRVHASVSRTIVEEPLLVGMSSSICVSVFRGLPLEKYAVLGYVVFFVVIMMIWEKRWKKKQNFNAFLLSTLFPISAFVLIRLFMGNSHASLWLFDSIYLYTIFVVSENIKNKPKFLFYFIVQSLFVLYVFDYLGAATFVVSFGVWGSVGLLLAKHVITKSSKGEQTRDRNVSTVYAG